MNNLNIKKRCALQYYFSRLYGRTSERIASNAIED